MGKTVPTYRMALEDEINSWRRFVDALDIRGREVVEVLMDAARNNSMAAGNACRPVVSKLWLCRYYSISRRK